MVVNVNSRATIGLDLPIYYIFSILSRPDMTFAVDWALNNNDLSICIVIAAVVIMAIRKSRFLRCYRGHRK